MWASIAARAARHAGSALTFTTNLDNAASGAAGALRRAGSRHIHVGGSHPISAAANSFREVGGKTGFSALLRSRCAAAAATGAAPWAQKLPWAPAPGHRGLHATPAASDADWDDELTEGEAIMDAVVKVYTVHCTPNYFMPWQSKPQRESTGSGFVIPGGSGGRRGRIMTNAHVVAEETFVLVKRHGSSRKFKATVAAIGHECDLALLDVEDPEFWAGPIQPLQLGEIPELQACVTVVGYPQGGGNISVTQGVVSRIEPTQYVHGAANLPAIQIDAAINPGNSGGPALLDGKVVGVAFQNLQGAENIGYIIPTPVIKHFIDDIDLEGKYVGFTALGVTCQSLENRQLREYLKVPDGVTGVMVNCVAPISESANRLKKDDVLMSIDGIPIANDGSITFRRRERIAFDFHICLKRAGETSLMRVFRDGEAMDVEVPMLPLEHLVPVHQYDRLPSYYIFAGLVFIPLTQPYLHEYGEEWYNICPRKLCDRALHGVLDERGRQCVILSQVLQDEVNVGYHNMGNHQVHKVNGIEIKNLAHLVEIVEGLLEGSSGVTHVRFDLDEDRVVVFDLEEARGSTSRLVARHRIASTKSQDLGGKVWKDEGGMAAAGGAGAEVAGL